MHSNANTDANNSSNGCRSDDGSCVSPSAATGAVQSCGSCCADLALSSNSSDRLGRTQKRSPPPPLAAYSSLPTLRTHRRSTLDSVADMYATTPPLSPRWIDDALAASPPPPSSPMTAAARSSSPARCRLEIFMDANDRYRALVEKVRGTVSEHDMYGFWP